jgi:hypothetical protein
MAAMKEAQRIAASRSPILHARLKANLRKRGFLERSVMAEIKFSRLSKARVSLEANAKQKLLGMLRERCAVLSIRKNGYLE